MNASNLGAASQLLYVKLAIKRGNWRDLQRHGAEPTPTMKLLFLKGREKYLAWCQRRDEEEDREPKEWIEITPGHWVRGKLIEIPENGNVVAGELADTRTFIDIDTSKTCPNCKMRRIEPGRTVCGNCISMGSGAP